MTSAPAKRATLIARPMSVTKYPVRSWPKGNGIGVWNAKTDKVPTDVHKYWNSVLLGTGRTFVTDRLDGCPPNVATKLLMKASNRLVQRIRVLNHIAGPRPRLHRLRAWHYRHVQSPPQATKRPPKPLSRRSGTRILSFRVASVGV